MDNSTDPQPRKKLLDNKAAKNYMKYSGMAFQIAAYVLVGIFVGKQLDKYFATSKPYFTALGAMLFLVAFLIKLINDLKRGIYRRLLQSNKFSMG
ncbi:MAG: AtpZ/AtpI family protein [Saprospiraceae bacterium]|nr:AtpZ/AtpI family protein [Saprospiraceae bacterium]